MAVPTLNAEVLISGILRRAGDQANPIAWLKLRHTEALDAVMAGDEYVTSTNYEGGGHTAERTLPANVLLQLYEVALQRLEAETAAEEAGLTMPGSVRHADFSHHPCTLG